MKRAVIYIHGKNGSAEEAAHYRTLFPESAVIGLDYRAQTPWDARKELPGLFDAATRGFSAVVLVANSIGAYFAMEALAEKRIEKACFVSPVADMERLICDMMHWAGVSEEELRAKREIETEFGETLSWDYLCYVRTHPIRWQIPTHILYGGRDALTARDTISAFAERIGASLTVMEDGEHWFHTEEQMAFLDRWVMRAAGSGTE